MFECLHDVRMVQPLETAKHGMVQQAIASAGHPVQLGHRPDRVQFHGAGQPHRVHRQRRPVQPVATQSHPGIPLVDNIHLLHAPVLQRPAFHIQPSHRLLPADPGGVFHL